MLTSHFDNPGSDKHLVWPDDRLSVSDMLNACPILQNNSSKTPKYTNFQPN